MNILYKKTCAAIFIFAAITSVATAQNTRVKTITIVNGDTTINESTEKNEDAKAVAYAYSFDDMDAENIEVTSDGEGNETKIIIKKDGNGKPARPAGGNETKNEKKIVTKTVVINDDGDEKEKESINMNINVKNTTVKVEITTNSKEPINISILDENGKQVFYESQKTGGNYSKEIPLGKKGIYFLNFIQNKKSKTEKIVVE